MDTPLIIGLISDSPAMKLSLNLNYEVCMVEYVALLGRMKPQPSRDNMDNTGRQDFSAFVRKTSVNYASYN
jgi:hypothetical protein